MLLVPLLIATESCESLYECGADWRISERMWNSLVVVTRSHVENSHKLFQSFLVVERSVTTRETLETLRSGVRSDS